jgi:CheY-like chemotaxis protein
MGLNKIEQMAAQRGRPFRILIVDDEPRVRDVFKEFCQITKGVEVEIAENGVDAVDKVKNDDYDLVTMDLIMPEMAGVEAVAKIKELKPQMPVIIITGNATERLINQAGLKGAASLLLKPVRLDDFVDEVTTALQRRSI